MRVEREVLIAVLDNGGEVSVRVRAHAVRTYRDAQPVDYPAGEITGLQPATRYWVWSDLGARRGEPTRYLASTDGMDPAHSEHLCLGIITTPGA